MIEAADITSDTHQNPIKFFRLKSSESKSRTSVGNMTRAVDSLAHFAAGTDLSFESFNADFLGEWVACQFYEGYYAKTVAYNISKIAALYNKAAEEGLALPNDAFPTVLAKINGVGSRFDGISHADTFQRLRTICRADYSKDSNRQLAKDIILFGIFNGGMTLEQIAAFTKDEYAGDNPHIAKIIEKYAKPKNKYLFPLRQAHSTPKQLMQSMQTLVGALFELIGIRAARATNMILADLWCDIAMNCGAASSEIAACVSGKGAYNALTFCAAPSEIHLGRISEIRIQVIEALTDNPVHWYAMHLRHNTNFRDLTGKLKETDIVLDEIFYPMEEIAKRVGKKIVTSRKPLVPGLLFFRAKATDVPRLYQHIGDLAWGYRQTREPRSPYAVIGASEIRCYQLAIGSITAGTEVYPAGTVELRPGDRLEVIGGEFAGYRATYAKTLTSATRTVYRLRLLGANAIEWVVDLPPHLLRPTTALPT